MAALCKIQQKQLGSWEMGSKAYFIFTIVTGLLKGAALLSIVLWLLPMWGVRIPVWGFILVVGAFLAYEIVTFRLGKRALEKKPAIWSEAIIGRLGKATTPLIPHGYVQVDGELWRAVSSDTNINEGDDLVVVEMDKLTLRVTSLAEKK